MTLKLEGDELCKLFRVKFPKYSDIQISPQSLNPLLESIGVVSLHEYEIMESGNEKNPSLINLQYCLQTREEVTINSNSIGIVLRRQHLDSGVDAPKTLEVEVKGVNQIHSRSSRTKNFVDVCKHYMTEGILQEISILHKQEAVNMSETDTTILERVLGSGLLDHGFIKAAFVNLEAGQRPLNQEHVDNREEMCLHFLNYIMTAIGFQDSNQQFFNQLTDSLQKLSLAKNAHINLLGKVGLIINKIVFLIILKHYNRLFEILAGRQEDEMQPDSDYKALWLASSKIRMIIRKYETTRQFEEFFRKVLFLLSIDPSDSWSLTKTLHAKEVPKNMTQEFMKVKIYLEELKNQSLSSINTDNTLPEIILKFLTIEAPVDSVIQIIEDKEKKFEAFGKAVDTISGLIKDVWQDIPQALLVLNRLFRKDNNLIDYFSVDYNGIAKEIIQKRLGVLKSIVSKIMTFLVKKAPGDYEKKEPDLLLALDSLKWMWRGTEIECINEIDISKIWSSNASYHDNKKFRASVIDLCFVMIKFCTRKTKEMDSAGEDDGPVLKKAVSIVDEVSMTSILNTNISLLVQILKENITCMKGIVPSLSIEEYKYLQPYINRNAESEKILASNLLFSFDKMSNSNDATTIQVSTDGCLKFPFPSKHIVHTEEIEVVTKVTKEVPIEEEGPQFEMAGLFEDAPATTTEVPPPAPPAPPAPPEEEEEEVSLGGLFGDTPPRSPRPARAVRRPEPVPAPAPAPAPAPVPAPAPEPTADNDDAFFGGLFDDDAPAPATAPAPAPAPTAATKKKTRTVTEEIKSKKTIERKEDNPEYSKITGLIKKLHENNRCIAAELQEAGKILSILHYYLISAPDMALCLFEEKKSLDPILELAFGNFPVIISQPSINLIQKLACHLPLNMISEELDIVSESINRIRPFYRNLFTEKNKEPVDEALVRCHISLLHKLLSLPSAKSNVLGQLKAVMEEGSLWSKYAVLDIINDERGQIREGDLVYNREDGLKEPLLVLGSHQGFKVKAYLRDILYYRYDIKERKDHWSCKEETHSEHKQLTVNLRTGNYSFVHPDFITRVTKDPEPAHIAWLTKELQLASISLAQTDPASLLLAYKLFKVFKSAKDKAAKAAAKALFASLGLNALCEQYRYASPPANKINEYIHHVAETEEWAIPQTPAAPAKPGLYQTLKNKMLNKVKATHKPQVATPQV
jgi:hypothetical protein